MIYLFPLEPFTKEDIKEAQRYGLTILGKNNYEGFDNLVVKGSLRALKNYAENYLGYELIPEYLYGDSRFDMDIEDMTIESFKESVSRDMVNLLYDAASDYFPEPNESGLDPDDDELFIKFEKLCKRYIRKNFSNGDIDEILDNESGELLDEVAQEIYDEAMDMLEGSLKESKKLEEGTGNFKMSSKGFPTYVYPEDDEYLGEDEDNALLQHEFEELQQEAEYFSEAELQDYISEVVEKMVDEGLIPEDEADYVIIEFGGHIRLVVEPGYYSSYSLSIQKPYDTPTNHDVSEEVMKKVEDAMVDAALEKAASLAEEYGLRKINVSARFSSGETWYQFEEQTDNYSDYTIPTVDFWEERTEKDASEGRIADILLDVKDFLEYYEDRIPEEYHWEKMFPQYVQAGIEFGLDKDKLNRVVDYINTGKGNPWKNESIKFRKINESFSWSEVDSHIDEIKDGATFENGKLASYDSGYQVAWHQSKEVKLDSLEEVKEYVNKNNLKSFGIWFDKDINKYVLDTDTMHVDDLEIALKIAKEANQKAIFDWSELESIYLDDVKDIKESVSEGEKLVRLQTITEEELDEWFEEDLIGEWDSTLYNLLSEESAEEFDNEQLEDEDDDDDYDDDDEEFEFRQKLEDFLRSDWYEKFSFEEKKEIYANNCVDFMDFDEDPMKKYRDAGIEFVGDDDEDDEAYVKESSVNERMIEYRIAKHDMNRVISTLKNKYREKNWKWVGGLHDALPYTNDDYYIIVAPNTKEFEWLNMYKPVISESIKESVKNGFMLVDSEGNEVNIGDEVTDFRGVKAKIVSLMPPRNSSSTGRLEVDYGNGDIRYLYAKVFNLYYVDAEELGELSSPENEFVNMLEEFDYEYECENSSCSKISMLWGHTELYIDLEEKSVINLLTGKSYSTLEELIDEIENH